MKSWIHLVKYALSLGYTVSVFDGEAWPVKRSTDFSPIAEAVESVEEAQIRIRDAAGNYIGWALVSPFGLADDETVIDFSDNEFMNHWNKQYQSLAA